MGDHGMGATHGDKALQVMAVMVYVVIKLMVMEDGDGVDGDDDSLVMVHGSETDEIVMMLVTGEDHWRR